jgi:endonuclease YncB( thermonuclease family)
MLWKAFLLIGVALVTGQAVAQPRTNSIISGLARVIDGDTINIDGRYIRLWGIDAFEMKQTCQQNNNTVPCGQHARAHLVELVGNNTVKCDIYTQDRYRRLIGICYVNNQNNISVNQHMVRNGWAFAAYHQQRYNFCDDEKIARSQGRGMWQLQSIQTPWAFRGGQSRKWCR